MLLLGGLGQVNPAPAARGDLAYGRDVHARIGGVVQGVHRGQGRGIEIGVGKAPRGC